MKKMNIFLNFPYSHKLSNYIMDGFQTSINYDENVSYDQILSAICKLHGPIYSYNDVQSFLESNSLYKSNTDRFLCWMVTFGYLNPNHDTWTKSLYVLYQNYQKLILNKFGSTPPDPFEAIPTKSRYVIKNDTDRGMGWFTEQSNSLNLPNFYTSCANFHSCRILALLNMDPQFNYCQGFDRYIFVSYLLSLSFSRGGGLPPSFAEAMTYYIGQQWLKMANISHYLEDPAHTVIEFDSFDKKVNELRPDIMKLLVDNGQGSFHYALRWKLLFFADEYSISNIFYIWDHILVNRFNLFEYLSSLCLSHIIQVPLAPPGEQMIEIIQKFKKWDPQKAVKDADQMMEKEKFHIPNFVRKYSLLVIVIFIFVFVILFFNH